MAGHENTNTYGGGMKHISFYLAKILKNIADQQTDQQRINELKEAMKQLTEEK